VGTMMPDSRAGMNWPRAPTVSMSSGISIQRFQSMLSLLMVHSMDSADARHVRWGWRSGASRRHSPWDTSDGRSKKGGGGCESAGTGCLICALLPLIATMKTEILDCREDLSTGMAGCTEGPNFAKLLRAGHPGKEVD